MAGQPSAASVVAGLSGFHPLPTRARSYCPRALASTSSQCPTRLPGWRALFVLADGVALVRRRPYRGDDRAMDSVVALLLRVVAGHWKVARTVIARGRQSENRVRSCRLSHCFSLTNTRPHRKL